MSAAPLDPIQQLAADYVLGTLSAGQRIEVEERLPKDARLRTAVQHWEAKLQPLTQLVEPVQPSPALWQRIENNLPARPRTAPAPKQGGLGHWWNSVAFWRFAAATGFAAASVMAIAPTAGLFAPARPQFMVVLVAPQGTAPGWVVQTSGQRNLKLIPVAPEPVPAQRSLQLWTKADGWTAPVSLGLVQPGQPIEIPLDKLPPIQPNQLFEITVEPYNGSPTGRPTGPIQFIGRTVQL
jgi:anti-sigma-K factor RskA